MKKYFIIAAFAVAAMACSKTESVPVATKDLPVSFAVVNHLHQSRATTTGLTYPTSVPFGTLAWWTLGEWTGIAADQTNVFMDNVEVSWHSLNPGEAEVWAPVETYYWTKSGKITFASYSPYTAAGNDKGYSEIPVYDVQDGFLFNNYTIVDDTDVDLMYANLAANCSQTTNADGSAVHDNLATSTDSGYQGVPTIFNHALCRIGFNIRAIGPKNPSVDTVVIRVDSVLIYNIDNKGSFKQAAATKWTTDHANYKDDYDFSPASPLELGLIRNTTANLQATDNYTDLGENKILLPQALLSANLATDQKLVLKYSVLTHYKSNPAVAGDPDYWVEEPLVSTKFLSSGNITSWGDNQNITYRISISPVADAITFDPAVLPWTDIFSNDVKVTPDE